MTRAMESGGRSLVIILQHKKATASICPARQLQKSCTGAVHKDAGSAVK